MKIQSLIGAFIAITISTQAFSASPDIAEKSKLCGVEKYNENKLSADTLRAITLASDQEMYDTYTIALKSSNPSLEAKDLGLSNLYYIAGDIYTARGTLCGLLEASNNASVKSITVGRKLQN